MIRQVAHLRANVCVCDYQVVSATRDVSGQVLGVSACDSSPVLSV